MVESLGYFLDKQRSPGAGQSRPPWVLPSANPCAERTRSQDRGVSGSLHVAMLRQNAQFWVTWHREHRLDHGRGAANLRRLALVPCGFGDCAASARSDRWQHLGRCWGTGPELRRVNGFAAYDMGYPAKNTSPSSAFEAVTQVPGNRFDLAGESYGGDWHTLVAQIAESGSSLEDSFAAGGFLSSTFGYASPRSAETELVEADGSIVVAGSWVVGKTTPTGQIDESFAAYPAHTEVHAIAKVAGGDLMAAGSETYGNLSYPATLERLLPNGERDVSFAEKGIDRLALLSGSEAKEEARSLLVAGDGKMIVAGTGSYNAGTRSDFNVVDFMWLTQLNADGSLDRSFGSGRGRLRVRVRRRLCAGTAAQRAPARARNCLRGPLQPQGRPHR